MLHIGQIPKRDFSSSTDIIQAPKQESSELMDNLKTPRYEEFFCNKRCFCRKMLTSQRIKEYNNAINLMVGFLNV